MKYLILFFLFSYPCFAKENRNHYKVNKLINNLNFAKNTNDKVIKILTDSYKKLPFEIIDALMDHSISIRFKMFDQHFPVDLITNCKDKESKKDKKGKLAQYVPNFFESKKHQIILHSGFIPYLLGDIDEKNFVCRHKSIKKTFIASFIHEVAHIYDKLNIMSDKFNENKLRQYCRTRETKPFWKSSRKVNLPAECKAIKKVKHTVSDRYPFVGIAAFSKSGSSKNKLGLAEFEHRRSPDVYEFQSLQESFAVNFEYFILCDCLA